MEKKWWHITFYLDGKVVYFDDFYCEYPDADKIAFSAGINYDDFIINEIINT